MKTYKQFSQELNEVAGAIKVIKGLSRVIKPSVKTVKKVGKLFKKKPRRTIDPFFADKAVERGTMVRGFHGQSAKNIAQYKKTGVPPTVSGLNPTVSSRGYNKATQDWMKRSNYKLTTKMARPGNDAYFATATETGKKQAGRYARRGANYENEKLKNVLNPFWTSCCSTAFAIVDFPEPDKPVIHNIAGFWFKASARCDFVTSVFCQ